MELFTLNALLEKRSRRGSPIHHNWMTEWMETGIAEGKGLVEWVREKFAWSSINTRELDRSRKQAEAWMAKGIWAAAWHESSLQLHRDWKCPGILFGIGNASSHQSWVGIFNSRKHKTVLPHEDWLVALRSFLPHIVAQGAGVASSVGTLTYDLAVAHAEMTNSPLLVVLPFPIEQIDRHSMSPMLPPTSTSGFTVTCLTNALQCAKQVRMVCRDRILARLSDVHLILAIRSGGNMERTISRQQADDPRPQWVLIPAQPSKEYLGNVHLFEASPQRANPFWIQRETDLHPAHSASAPEAHQFPWGDYLYHYTRSCTGPWPGQSYREYLASLLRGDPDSGHTALDTLIRILREGRIRAGARLVRGSEAVVSWTSRSPGELSSIRRWNPALIRWTFEGYGIAVSRRILRKEGAKPTIYGSDSTYSKLREVERYRFQLHRPPDCSWKHEREWRTHGDLILENIPTDEAFLFVSRPDEAARLKSETACRRRVIILHENFESGRNNVRIAHSPIN